MDIRIKFKQHARLIYKVAVQCNGHSDDFGVVVDGRTYIFHALHGAIDGLILAEVCSVDDVKACHQYAAIVVKAYDRFYIKPAIHK